MNLVFHTFKYIQNRQYTHLNKFTKNIVCVFMFYSYKICSNRTIVELVLRNLPWEQNLFINIWVVTFSVSVIKLIAPSTNSLNNGGRVLRLFLPEELQIGSIINLLSQNTFRSFFSFQLDILKRKERYLFSLFMSIHVFYNFHNM